MSLTKRVIERMDPVARARIEADLFDRTMGALAEADYRARALDPVGPVASVPRVRRLPKNVCFLDIETSSTSFKSPERSVIAIVGLMFYRLAGTGYRFVRHEVFRKDDLPRLRQRLVSFRGVIVGHNVFGFDFRALRARIPLDGIIEKSADTLVCLYELNGRQLHGTGLDGVCRANFNAGKTLPGRTVSAAWRAGQHAKVVAYNKNDLLLTKMLWWQIVKRRVVEIRRLNRFGDVIASVAGRVTASTLGPLLCSPSLFTLDAWTERLAEEGSILVKNGPLTISSPSDEDLDPADHVPIRRCEACDSPRLRRLEADDLDLDDATEGQLAEYLSGNWGGVLCLDCGNVSSWEQL